MSLSLRPPRVRIGSLLPPPGEVDPRSPALSAQDGTVVAHGVLRQRVMALASDLPDAQEGRLLAHVRLAPTVDAVVAYLAIIEAGHVPLLIGNGDAVAKAWPADLVAESGSISAAHDADPAPRHLLHPDLSLLLSTSGSTGSPKLVRLSHDNVASNARAIASALGLGPRDRGVTSLPLHYCFGLSVLHSHLAVGASVALTDASVLDPAFWDVVDDGVTNLAVVPHMVELMEGTGALERPHPALRLVTQAGGRMSPERVARTARLGQRHGWGLAVMYGQSEATARIAVQRPELAAISPDSVGHPIPGTSLRLDTDVPEADDVAGSGEIVVSGPGVMLGYAEHPDDLALGRMVPELRTGDLGVLGEDGALRIVGRRSGFVKLLGQRIDLARVEAALEKAGLVACVTGDDAGIRVAVEPVEGEAESATRSRARRITAESCGLGVGHVRAAALPLARLSNGKVDRSGCDALVRVADPEECADARQRIDTPGPSVRAAAVLGDVLGRDDIDLHQSFVAMGGDSLSHVQASARLSQVLGELPRDWHRRPVAELVAAAAPVDTPPGARRRGWQKLETPVLLRALAVIMIAGSHAELFRLLGGAHTLMVVAGFSAAMFGLSAQNVPQRWRGAARFIIGIGVPTMVMAAVGMTYGRYHWGNLLLINWATGSSGALRRNELWFVDALILCILLTTAILSQRRIARAWLTDPWRVAFALLLLGLVSRFVILGIFEGTLRGIMPTVFFLFATGLALAHAQTWPRRLLTLGAAAAGVVGFFPDDPARNATILAGIAILALLRSVKVPTVVVPLITLLAAASLHIYLVQFHVQALIEQPLLGTLASLFAGVLFWRLTAGPLHQLQELVPLVRRRQPAPSTTVPERTNP